MLNSLLNNQNVDAETKKIAQKRLLAITDALDEELLLTNLLNAKYDTQTAVFVQEEEVNVIIKKAPGSLKQADIEKIAQIVNSQTGVGFENVVIVLKN